MRRIRLLIALGVSLTILVLPQNIVIAKEDESNIIHSGSYEKGYRYNIQGWVYIHIEGEPYERGYQYGYLASAEIVDMINRWSNFGHNEEFMKIFIFQQSPKNYYKLSETYWSLCRHRGMKFFWDQYPKEYQEEIKGIADGVRERGGIVHGRPVDYKDIFTLNVIEETRETFSNPGGFGRPIKTLLSYAKGFIKDLFKKTSELKDEELKGLNNRAPNDYKELSHCTAFIATGEATTDGQIVASHSLIFSNYMAQRTNMILDVQPSNGYRFVMTVFPGYIWSSQDFHENEQGIILMETVIWPPIGPWKVRGKIPVGVRVRKAIQYSDSIDDVIQTMLDSNNGLYPADWVMGDTKTGEIASLELGLYNHAITRTKDGYLWSCSNAKNDKVRWEQWSITRLGILGRIIFNKFRPTYIDKKFKELGDKYYGEIDVEIVKEIMSTEEICSLTTDCKITDTKLIEDLGLWAHQGRPDGFHWKPSSEVEERFRGVSENPGTGWLKLYASNSEPRDFNSNGKVTEKIPKKLSNLLWEYKTEYSKNMDYGTFATSEDTLFVATSASSIFALNPSRGNLLWEHQVSEKLNTPSVSKEYVFTGSESGLRAINKESGVVKWEKNIGRISSKPIVTKDTVIAGCSDGNIYAFDMGTGEVKWSYQFPTSTTISEIHGNIIYVCSDDACYAFNMKNKEVKWEFETGGIITATPYIKDNIAYFGSWDGNVYAVNTKNGEVKWVFETGWGVDTTPTVSDGIVFVGSMDNNFYALDEKSGELKWFFTCLAGIHSSPVTYGDFVFFGSDDGKLYALNKETGELEWDFAPGFSLKKDDANNFLTTPILSDPVVKDGVVYIDVKGTIYALDSQTFEQPEAVHKKSDGEGEVPGFILFILMALLGLILIFIPYSKKKKEK